MHIITKTKNIELTEELNNFIESKFDKLKKFIDILKREDPMGKTLAEIFVEIQKETNHHKNGDIFQVEASIQLPGKNLVARAHGDDMMKVILEVKDELEREIEKYKFKKIDSERRDRGKEKIDF